MKAFKIIFLLLIISVAGQEVAPVGTYDNSRVVISWDLYEDPNEAVDIAGFRAHLGPQSGEYTDIINMGRAYKTPTAYRWIFDGNLKPHDVWFMSITAYNTYGLESDYSNEISFTVKDKPNLPSTPTNYRLIQP